MDMAVGTTSLVCTLDTMPRDERERHSAVVHDWRMRVDERLELADGFAYRFASDTAIIMTLAEFISRERLCCPFFRFQVDVEPGGPLWLRVTGPDGAKELLEGFFGST